MDPRKAKKAKTLPSWDEVMDPNGDITLVVGEEKVRLRCARSILCLSSPVLMKMLGPDSPFLEANVTDISDDGTKHVYLPADELEPLSFLLRIIHHKIEGVPWKVPLVLLVKLAVVGDKYDLHPCIRQWMTKWSNGFMIPDDRTLLFVGLISKNSEIFEKASASLIVNSPYNTEGRKFDTHTEIDGVLEWVLREKQNPPIFNQANVIPQHR